MATTTSNLDIKIRALVEGLKSLGDLGQSLVDVAKQAQALDEVSNSLDNIGKKGQQAASDLDKAFKTLGGRSTQAIEADLQSVASALEAVRKGGAGLAEVARAEELAASATKRLNAEMSNPAPRNFSDKLGDLGVKLRALDFKGLRVDAESLLGSFGGLTKVVGPLATALIALTGIKALSSLAVEAANVAARVETLGVTLNVVGRNAGYSRAELEKQEEALRNTGITTEATRKSLINMIQSGIKITELSDNIVKANQGITKSAELARAAQDLAVVTGENSSQTLERLITNIQQRDTVGLRFMGLTVNMEAAEAKFAATLGKSAASLTETEKKQASLNAVLTEAAKLSGAYEEALETVGKKLSSLQRYQDEFVLSLGKKLTPAYGALVDAATAYLKESTAISDSFAKTSNTADDLRAGLEPIVTLIKDIAVFGTAISLDVFQGLAQVFRQIGGVVGEITGFVKDAYQSFSQLFGEGTQDGKDFIKALDPIKGFFTGVSLAVAAFSDGLTAVFAVVQEFGSILAGTFATILEKVGGFVGFFNKDLGDALISAAKGFQKFADSSEKAAQKNIDKLGEGRGALGKFVADYDKADSAGNKVTANVAAFSAQIQKLTTDQASNRITSQQFAAQYEDISKKLFDSASQAGLTKKEFGDLNRQLQESAGSLGKEFTEAAQAAGFSLAELRNNSTKEVAAGASALSALVKGAATQNEAILVGMGTSLAKVGTDVLTVYAKFADQARTIQDLTLLNNVLIQARANGTITEQAYTDALGRSSAKLNDILQAGLKAATTQADYDKLTAAVTELGNTGTVAGSQVAGALQLIAREANKATGEYAKLAQSAQRVAVSAAQVTLAKANYDVNVATVAVVKAQNELALASLEYSRDGSQISRLNVDIARQNVEIAKQDLELARTNASERKSALDLLIAKQQELNATRALEGHGDDEVLQAALKNAQDRARAQEEINNNAQEAVNKQQLAVQASQEQLLKLTAQRDALQQQADYWDAIIGKQRTSSSIPPAGSPSPSPNGGPSPSGPPGSPGNPKPGTTQNKGGRGPNGEYLNNADSIGEIKSGGQEIKSRFGATAEDRLQGQNAVDNTLQFKLRDKLKAGTLGTEDIGGLKAVIEALKQNNLQNAQVQKHGAFIGLDGLRDDQAWQRTGQGFAEALVKLQRQQQQTQAPVGSPAAIGGANIAASNPAAVAPDAKSVSSPPSKKVQIDFSNGGQKKVSAAVDDGADADLLKMLKQAQSRT